MKWCVSDVCLTTSVCHVHHEYSRHHSMRCTGAGAYRAALHTSCLSHIAVYYVCVREVEAWFRQSGHNGEETNNFPPWSFSHPLWWGLIMFVSAFQYFDTVGWTTGRASGIRKRECWHIDDGDLTGVLHVLEFQLLGYWHQRADERHGNPPPR